MSVTGAPPTYPRDPVLTQVAKITGSDILRSSESLCRLLRYLADQSLGNPGASVKEYQIATEVFGRPSDFDPRLDSTVRVQTSRLRSKLAEYYGGPGAGDQVIIELPKGSYSLAVHARPVPAEPATLSVAAIDTPIAAGPGQNVAVWALAFLCAGLAIALIYLALRKPGIAIPAREPAPASLLTFWHGFIDTPQAPVVVFSNAEFVGRPETGMRYFVPGKDDRSAVLDHYTGTGEVIAIHELDRLFTDLHHSVLVKRGRLLAMDDAKTNDLIFVGSPSENLSLRDLPSTQEFVFRRTDKAARKGDLAIFNDKPRIGEEPVYFASAGQPITEDYAVVALLPGLTGSHSILILAGITTIGTQAAVEYVCRAANVETLLKRIGRLPGGDVMPFEAVLRVKISRGVPVATELAAIHTRGS